MIFPKLYPFAKNSQFGSNFGKLAYITNNISFVEERNNHNTILSYPNLSKNIILFLVCSSILFTAILVTTLPF